MTRYKIPADLIADGDQDEAEKLCRSQASTVGQSDRELLVALADAKPDMGVQALHLALAFGHGLYVSPGAIAVLLQDGGR